MHVNPTPSDALLCLDPLTRRMRFIPDPHAGGSSTLTLSCVAITAGLKASIAKVKTSTKKTCRKFKACLCQLSHQARLRQRNGQSPTCQNCQTRSGATPDLISMVNHTNNNFFRNRNVMPAVSSTPSQTKPCCSALSKTLLLPFAVPSPVAIARLRSTMPSLSWLTPNFGTCACGCLQPSQDCSSLQCPSLLKMILHVSLPPPPVSIPVFPRTV